MTKILTIIYTNKLKRLHLKYAQMTQQRELTPLERETLTTMAEIINYLSK